MRRCVPYLLLTVLPLGCGDEPFDPRTGLEPFAGGVSDPVDGVAWVSAAPGTQPNASTATIRNERTGQSVAAQISSRGFDPVSLEAAAGDLLIIEFGAGGDAAERVQAEVPAARPPRVIRTVSTGLAPDAPIVVMFSEPIAPASITPQTLTLNSGGQRVAAAATALPPPSLGARLVPAEPLAWGSTYELVLGAAIEDVTGDPLDGPRAFSVSTAPDANPVMIGVAAEVIDFGYAPGGAERPAAFTSDKPVGPGQFTSRIRGDPAFRVGAGDCASEWELHDLHRCELAVRFAPGAGDPRTYSATLELSDASGVRAAIALRASTRGPTLDVRTTGGFPETVMVGFASDPVTVTVTNVGAAPTELLATRHFVYEWENGWYEAPPESSALQVTDDRCDGTALAPGASCTLLVAFAPRMAVWTEEALFFDDAHTGRLDVAGSGTGLLAVPSNQAFPSIPIGTSLTGSLVLMNSGDHETGLVTVEMGSGPFSLIPELDQCSGRRLAPEAACSVSYRFAPDAPGFFSGSLLFTASPGGEARSWLSGTAH